MARSAKHLPKYAPQTWSYYSPNATDPNQLTNAELVKVIRKAAKAANQRLRALEKTTSLTRQRLGLISTQKVKCRAKSSPALMSGPKRALQERR